MILRILNWEKFQHYKDRRPPWIKLHHSLLDDYAFHCLPDASRAIAPCLWLLASEQLDGSIELDWDGIAFRLHTTAEKVKIACKPLMDKGFISVDSEMLAPCKQDATSETETETYKQEGETEAEKLALAQFQMFWSSYPRQLDPDLSKQKFLSLSLIDQQKAIESLPAWMDSSDWDDPQYIPKPVTFLDRRRWESRPMAKKGVIDERRLAEIRAKRR